MGKPVIVNLKDLKDSTAQRVLDILCGAIYALKGGLCELADLENSVDGMKKELIASHFSRLAEGNCSIEVSPYYSSAILGIERVADHLVNIGYSIVNPVGTLEEN